MPAAFVIDASVTLAGVLPDESHAGARRILSAAMRAGAAAPPVWAFEVANVLVVKMRKGVLTPDQTREIFEVLRGIELAEDACEPMRAGVAAFDLAVRRKLSVYDASYLRLALDLGLPLATLDMRLAAAARAEGCAVLP